MNYPTITCEIAFDSKPMATTQLYQDVSARLRGQVTITRGRPHEMDQIDIGTATLTLDNRDGALNPFNSASPYAPNIVPRRRLRLQATTPAIANGQQVINLGGASGLFRLSAGGQQTGVLSSAATASQLQAALEVLSTIGAGNVSVTGAAGGPWMAIFGEAFRWTATPLLSVVAPTLTGGSASATTTQQGSPGANGRFRITTDATAGSSAVTVIAPSASGGSALIFLDLTQTAPGLQAQLNAVLGAGNSLVTGAVADWTIEFTGANGNSAGVNIGLGGNGPLTPPSATVTLWFLQNGAAARNEIQRITLGGATGGSWRATFGGQQTSDLAWNASPGQVQSALAALSSVGAGNVSVTSGGTGIYIVTFTGALGLSNQPQLTIQAGLSGGTPTITPSTLPPHSYPLFTGFIEDWPPEEPAGTIGDAVVSLTVSDALMLFGRKRINGSLGIAVPTVTTTIPGGGGVNEVQTLKLNGAGTGSFRLRFDGVSTTSLGWNATAAQIQTALRGLSSIGGANVTVTGTNGTYTITFIGTLAGINVSLIIADHSFPGQRSDLMIAQILDALGWPAADRDLEPGRSVLADAALDDQPALQLLQLIAASENGVIFISPAGKVVFQNRHRRTRQGAPLFIIGSPAQNDELPCVSLTPSFDDSWLYNEIAISAQGGDPQIARDATSEEDYFTSTYSKQTLITTDSEALSAAQYLLARHSVPAARIPAAVLRGVLEPARLWPQLLGREIGERGRVTKRLRGGGTISLDVYIEAIQHVITRDDRSGARDWVTTWQLSPAQTTGFWILGDAVWGVLGVTTKLAY